MSSGEERSAAFVAAPHWRRTLRRWKRVGRYHLMTWLFDRGILDGEKVVGSFWRERRGERAEVVVTRRKSEHGRLMIVPPGEWQQDEADAAIRRGQELARKHGW